MIGQRASRCDGSSFLIFLFSLSISHADGKIAFCIFLRSEFCDENIEFWSACEEFKKIKSRKEMVSKANRIYEEFIKSEAPKEVTANRWLRICLFFLSWF